VLFALSYSRSRIAKEKQAIIVEGQIDALRLIHAGFNYAVAGQGTAFGQEHAKELIQLGVSKVYLALDGDKAGQEAAVKIGNLFQLKGVEVLVVPFEEGSDPDTVLSEWGPEHFAALLAQSRDYLTFLFSHLSKGNDMSSPSKKNEVVTQIVDKIKSWEQPVMVHESLKKLAELAQVPEAMLGVGQISLPDLFIRKSGSIQFHEVNPDRILEGDFIRWLIFAAPEHPVIEKIAAANIREEHFRILGAKRLYSEFFLSRQEGRTCDLLSLGSCLESEEDQKLLLEIMQRKVNLLKAVEGFTETVRKILVRQWMEEREAIRTKIHSGSLSDEDALQLARQFDELKKRVPQVASGDG
jgi:DNA primase